MMTDRIILGLDPGLATIGYAFVKCSGSDISLLEFGVIETSPDLSFSERLLRIHEDLLQLLHTFMPVEAYTEELFFSSNTATALQVAHARGVLLMTCMMKGLPLLSFTPNQIKSQVTGFGAADKRQVQEMLMRIFSLPHLPRPDDAADALAIAYLGSFQNP